jgi:hypothetical protein
VKRDMHKTSKLDDKIIKNTIKIPIPLTKDTAFFILRIGVNAASNGCSQLLYATMMPPCIAEI